MTIRESRRRELDAIKFAVRALTTHITTASADDNFEAIWRALGALEALDTIESGEGLSEVAHRDRRLTIEAMMMTDDQITEAVHKAFPDLDEIDSIISHFTLDEDSDCLYRSREPAPSPAVDHGLMAELDRLSSEFVDPLIASRNTPR